MLQIATFGSREAEPRYHRQAEYQRTSSSGEGPLGAGLVRDDPPPQRAQRERSEEDQCRYRKRTPSDPCGCAALCRQNQTLILFGSLALGALQWGVIANQAG